MFISICRPSATAITLDPVAATNEVGTNHTVTATVTNLGQPIAGVVVRFSVAGSVTAAGSCTTDALGQCSFTYTGPALPGADLIAAYADDDGDAEQDVTEPVAAATKAWTMTAAAFGHVTGGGHVLTMTGTGDVAFGFDAKRDGVLFHGRCNVVDRLADVRVKCLDVTSLVVVGTHATFRGNATVNGVATTYVIDVDDLGEPGAGHDTFRLVTPEYETGGVLTQANIQIH